MIKIEKAGGKALPIVVDIRSEEMIQNAVNKTVETFGGIDILINNASAISLTPIEQTTQKRSTGYDHFLFDLVAIANIFCIEN